MSELDLTVIRKVGVARALEDWTADLTATGAPWGPARKSLNLFLRDLTYNHWTRAHYDMAAFKSDLELPLDGIVMTKVREFKNDLPLSSVKALSAAVSELYQSAGSDSARQQTTLRIHLDIEMWGAEAGLKDNWNNAGS